MKNFRIHIKGQVQGVGFRPYIYRLAKSKKINGEVSNDVKGVHIEIQCSNEKAKDFLNCILSHPPAQSRIDTCEIHEVAVQHFNDFSIVDSKPQGLLEVRLSPDFGLCSECRNELSNPNNQRYKYVFTTCTNCGPRYSIISDLPYDRPNTTMANFPMCPDCEKEFTNPANRRFYSQTNSCPKCAIIMTLFANGVKKELSQEEIIKSAVKALKEGQILAVKGIGGYLLLCDASNTQTIKRLRIKKNRADKPFAVLYPNIETVKALFDCSVEEEGLLQDSKSPIVLLSPKKDIKHSISLREIAPNLNHIGVMLPYAPLLYILSLEFGSPLIATSANLSGSPIIYEDTQAIQELPRFCDLVLVHDRAITSPQDDSVIKFNKSIKTPIFHRRSRGFAPSYFGLIPKEIFHRDF